MKMQKGSSTITFHPEYALFKQKSGKLTFLSRAIAVRDLYSPGGSEKTLKYERLSLKSGYLHVEIRDTLQVFGIFMTCQVLCIYSANH